VADCSWVETHLTDCNANWVLIDLLGANHAE
jgi:hypothetical protein